MELAHKYLEKLGFSADTESSDFGEIFLNIITINSKTNSKISIPFIFYKNENTLFEYYLDEWNKNEINYFIAVGSDKSYIVNAKEKTKSKKLLKSSLIIDSFDYGTNTIGYNIIPQELPYAKDNIDNSLFFDFVLKKQKEVKNEIDTYLLNSLVALKDELLKFDDNNENINGLILKSLFVKYLEDREILTKTSITKVLKEGNPSALSEMFSDIAVINGDILKRDLIITEKHITELEIFYNHDYKEYKKGQPKLFYPYKFNKIPIQLISNVYEEFLGRTNKEEKKSKGIFYTRTFVIDFMLSHTIYPKIKKQPNSTILDPACGSGAFLVQAFNKILKSQHKKNLSIDEKAEILQKQIFGVDIDGNALQITAFSLYLTLLDGISKKEIQVQIEKSTPILPSLIGYNLLQKNTIVDNIKFEFEINSTIYSFTKFDCIVANPPWYIVNNTPEDIKIKLEHKANEIYKSIHQRYRQLSQFFLLKILELSHNDTEVTIITNSSNFYSSFSNQFREEILSKFRLKKFFELSKLKSILFKKAGEPASVLILDTKINENNIIDFIVPDLTKFSKKLRLITYSFADLKKVKQTELREEHILWRVLLNGNWKDYQLIKKQIINKDDNIKISCEQGIQGQIIPSFIINKQSINILKKLNSYDNHYITEIEKLSNKYFHTHTELKTKIKSITDKHNIKLDNNTFLKIKNLCDRQIIETTPKEIIKYFDKDDFQRLSFGLDENFITSIKKEINWNNNIKRKRNAKLFCGERILVLRQPQKENDNLRLKTLLTNQQFAFPDKVMGIKILPEQNYRLLLGILSSKFAGYYLINTSSQWHKGRRDTLLNEDFEKFPIPKTENTTIKNQIINNINIIEQHKKTKKSTSQIEKQLDELVFDLYELLEFEKEIIREFYQINVERKNNTVKPQDIQKYIEAFQDTYQLMIKENLRLNASFIISTNIGAIVKFNIVDKDDFISEVKYGNFTQRQVLNLVKEHQIQKELLNGSINEEKVKIYEGKSFYIIKSNQFKDWTKRQAMEDANEEAKEILKKLL